ncbi:MAG: 5-formyltetrahydrofolate cyclo-ligase, partial [Acidocella sp. 20-61-6]
MSGLETEKARARQAALRARAACDPALGAALARHVLRECRPPPDAIVAGFWPLPGEIDILPLLHALARTGQRLCLPVTPPRGQPLSFRRWQPGAALLPGRFGTQHPDGDTLVPDFLLVPLLAFDAAGNRLGYGGGYYDRTLAALPGAFRLGCAFGAQEMPQVPVGATDLPMHAVAT